MTKEAVNKVKLSQMLRNGASQRECAKHFNVSPGRISQIKKELNISVIKNVALENAHNIVSRELDAVGQLYKINEEANRLLSIMGDVVCYLVYLQLYFQIFISVIPGNLGDVLD